MKKAAKWTKYELYQESVQNPEFEVEFIRETYTHHRKKKPLRMREDFCGTALICCEWARQVPDGKAVGIDLDAPTLKWAADHNLKKLNSDASRVTLLERDVMDATRVKADIIAALNFSYFIFKKRADLLRYFERAYQALLRDGMLVLDLYGGPEAQVEQEEITEQDSGFDYVWDQALYNPVTGETRCHIHFDFPNGKRMKRAFTYDWRLWTIPEVRDILADAGFKESFVYWEGTDEEDESGNGEFTQSEKGDDAQSWIAYIVALK